MNRRLFAKPFGVKETVVTYFHRIETRAERSVLEKGDTVTWDFVVAQGNTNPLSSPAYLPTIDAEAVEIFSSLNPERIVLYALR